MKLGITGLPGCGKSTIFEALTRNFQDAQNKSEDRIGTIRVPDVRVDRLSRIYTPQKTIYAQVEYFLPAAPSRKGDTVNDQPVYNRIRDCHALIHVLRNFTGFDGAPPDPRADFKQLEQEMILSDLITVEKRLERLGMDQKRGKKPDPEEKALLTECRVRLENEEPIRNYPEAANAPLLKGFAFVSAKPLLVLFNNPDEDDGAPDPRRFGDGKDFIVVRGKLEHELAQMSSKEAQAFMAEYDITESAMDRAIHKSYELLGMISFFTVGQDEVRAWTIKSGTPAREAAGTIHSDMKKGFIRAEVLAYEDLMTAGSYHEARKQGMTRLEGKTYEIKDGDIITFRFNV
ncbi:MAG: DUF933 domain-containing protein [Desulfobacterales bacterium]